MGLNCNQKQGQSPRQFRCSFNLKKVVERVSALFDLDKDDITSSGRQREGVGARDLLCTRCALEPEISMINVSRRLGLTLAAVSYPVKRGRKTEKGAGYRLDE